MNIFSEYAEYYNLLYKDKNYSGEAGYVASLLERYNDGFPGLLLDVGCGTGRHAALLADKGCKIYGVDLSRDMLKQAEAGIPDGTFSCSKASEFSFDVKFDSVVSLFHVVSYFCENDELEKSLKNIYTHLKTGGVFLFDFWYGPAVLRDLPEVRIKRLENENIKVLRIAEPDIDYNRNTVCVNYELQITNKHTGELKIHKESHQMRYLFLPELEYMLAKTGFEVLHTAKWMSEDGLSEKSWNGVMVVRK